MADTKKNFLKVLASFEASLAEPVVNQRDLAGVIQNFEFVYELAWKALKVILTQEGQSTGTPREAFVAAYKAGILEHEDLWLQIIKDRNLTVHTYDETFAKEMLGRIQIQYAPEFYRLRKVIEKRL